MATTLERCWTFSPFEKSLPAYLPLLNWKTFYESKTVITDLHRPYPTALLNNSRDDKSLTELNAFSATPPFPREKLRDGGNPTWPTHSLPSYKLQVPDETLQPRKIVPPRCGRNFKSGLYFLVRLGFYKTWLMSHPTV